jgi:hypothetical protein
VEDRNETEGEAVVEARSVRAGGIVAARSRSVRAALVTRIPSTTVRWRAGRVVAWWTRAR